MKQILQNLKTGQTELVEVPCPQARPNHILIKTSLSLISAGTERMLIDFGRSNYLKKAKQQPEKVRQVIDKVRADGFMPTIEAVRSKLDQPLPLGYCNVGIVEEIADHGFRISDLEIGNRVVSNGPHAEIVCVPKNLWAKIPDDVSDEEAAFTIVGTIGLQGIRLAHPTLGERFVVIGLGLIGLLTVQILKANGCQVLGIDRDSVKCALAQQFGIATVNLSSGEEPVDIANTFSDGRGVDGVLITAATKSSKPVHQAMQMCRKRGRIVLIGVTGLKFNREDFYEKELTFQVSCSYGPGRYDPEYEEKGHDYPYGFVRWTEQRNFEAILELMASGKLNVKPLITHRFPFAEAERAYQMISKSTEPYIGIILQYPAEVRSIADDKTIALRSDGHRLSHQHNGLENGTDPAKLVIGMIGAGNFTGQVLLPALKKTTARLKTIACRQGVTGTHLGKKFGFEQSTTDVENIFIDPEVNTVFITTRHNTHAKYVLQALEAGKHIFVEKPLCLNMQEFHTIIERYNSQLATRNSQLKLMVGFNRRFSLHVAKIQELLSPLKKPKSLIMTVNAGFIPVTHWTQDPAVGGGRIIGETCHFVDLLRFIAGHPIISHNITYLPTGTRDTTTIQLAFADGSIGTIHYFANGNKQFPKERLEVFCEGKILQLDNFRILRGYGWRKFKNMRLWRQDKGHEAEMKAFVKAIEQDQPAPISFEEIVEITRVTPELTQVSIERHG